MSYRSLSPKVLSLGKTFRLTGLTYGYAPGASDKERAADFPPRKKPETLPSLSYRFLGPEVLLESLGKTLGLTGLTYGYAPKVSDKERVADFSPRKKSET